MKAAWYERQGPPARVLVVGEMTTPEPGPGEVRIRGAGSGINPGDVKKRQDAFGVGMPFPRVVPHNRAVTIPHAMRLNAMLTKNQIICCGTIMSPL